MRFPGMIEPLARLVIVTLAAVLSYRMTSRTPVVPPCKWAVGALGGAASPCDIWNSGRSHDRRHMQDRTCQYDQHERTSLSLLRDCSIHTRIDLVWRRGLPSSVLHIFGIRGNRCIGVVAVTVAFGVQTAFPVTVYALPVISSFEAGFERSESFDGRLQRDTFCMKGRS